MVSLFALWMPILLAAILVFFSSSIIHMVVKYHNSDYNALPQEDDVMAAMRAAGVTPGDYVMPCPDGASGMSDPEFAEKWAEGPAAFMTVMPTGPMNMTKQLTQWFVYSLVVGVVAGYVASRTVGPDPHYLFVFRITGTVAFASYSLALLQNSIWYHRAWTSTLKSVFDGLIYALLTAGCFGWLWPA